jgi:DNA-binding GntR family transcriptional regulator
VSRQSLSTGPEPLSAAEHTSAPRGEGLLREQITDLLRAAVLSGRLRPGVVYSARSLAGQLGVSPTPVREALLDLVRRGLMESRRNRGFLLCSYSSADRAQFTSLLYLLEAYVFEVQPAAAYGRAVDALEQHASRAGAAAEAGDVGAFLESEDRFHHGLCLLSGNRVLGETVLDLRGRMRLHDLSTSIPPGDLSDKAAEHFELLRLLRLRESAPALRVLENHIVGDREEATHAAES